MPAEKLSADGSYQLAVRVEPSVAAELEKLTKDMSRHAGVKLSRSQVLREVVREGIAALQRRVSRKGKQ